MLNNLPENFTKDEGSNLAKFLSTFQEEINQVETVMNQVKLSHFIDTATGRSLELIGESVGEIRPSGLSDSNYRTLIKSKILLNFSNGDINSYLKYITEFLQTSNYSLKETDWDVENTPRLNLKIPKSIIDGLNYQLSNQQIRDRLSLGKAAGVIFEMFVENNFEFGTNEGETSTSTGFGVGRLSEVYD